MFHQGRQHTILFCRDIRKIKKELQVVPFSKASAIISEESKKVKASDKEMKKYGDLCEEDKRRHEEALQRYQDHIDEMEIINLHKRKKARKTPQPKKAPKSPKSDEPEKSPKSSDEKKIATKTGKRTVRKTPQPKRAAKSPQFNQTDDSSNDDEQKPKKSPKSNDEKETS